MQKFEERFVTVNEIEDGVKNIAIKFIILERGEITVTKTKREIHNFKAADQTGCINVSIWDERGRIIMPGDILRVTKGFAVVWRRHLTFYAGESSVIEKVDEFCMLFNEDRNMSELIDSERVEQKRTISPPSIKWQNKPCIVSKTAKVNKNDNKITSIGKQNQQQKARTDRHRRRATSSPKQTKRAFLQQNKNNNANISSDNESNWDSN